MGKVYACSDLHGMMLLYKEICNFLYPDDKVYFLGDAADRGSDGWEIIKAIRENPQWTYLMGNHENMLYKAMKERANDEYGEDTILLYENGGYETLESWATEGSNTEWINYLRKLPMIKKYKNTQGYDLILCHAGFTPFEDNYNNITPNFLPSDNDCYIWNREHIQRPWRSEADNTIIVHGHTPGPYIAKELNMEWKPGALWYCNDHKVCIDNGSFATGKICLLDLDTFDEHIFEIPNFIYF